MEKIIDGMLYTFGSTIIIVPIFYFGTLQLMQFKKDIVATSMDQFTNNLFGNIFRPPVTASTITNVSSSPTPSIYATKKEEPTRITSFFVKKRGIN